MAKADVLKRLLTGPFASAGMAVVPNRVPPINALSGDKTNSTTFPIPTNNCKTIFNFL